MHEPWLSHISMGDPFRVLAFLFPHSRGLKPTATYGMPLQGMKQSLITSFLFNNSEIRSRTYEILYLVHIRFELDLFALQCGSELRLHKLESHGADYVRRREEEG
jgi:hypothetical protein